MSMNATDTDPWALITPDRPVFYERDSIYAFEVLCERDYILKVLDEVWKQLGEFSDTCAFFIQASNRPWKVPAPKTLPGRRSYLLSLSDETAFCPLNLRSSFRGVFKIYLNREWREPGFFVLPFPLGLINEYPLLPMKRWRERKHLAYFHGNLNLSRINLARAGTWLGYLPAFLARRLVAGGKSALLAPLLKKRPGMQGISLHFSQGFRAGLPLNAYAAEIRDTQFALCPRGFSSSETFRHSEAAAAGAIVITEALPRNALYEGAPFITVSTWGEGLRTIRALSRLPGEELESMAMATRDWFDAKIAPGAVARYIVGEILTQESSC